MEIKEAYCSYEVAKLLKEKGFDEPCECFYDSENNDVSIVNGWMNISNSELEEREFVCYSAPTHQMACAWIRKKGWHISIQLTYDDNYNAVYYVTISSTKTFLAEDIGELEYKYFSKVEDANNEALKYSLENLI